MLVGSGPSPSDMASLELLLHHRCLLFHVLSREVPPPTAQLVLPPSGGSDGRDGSGTAVRRNAVEAKDTYAKATFQKVPGDAYGLVQGGRALGQLGWAGNGSLHETTLFDQGTRTTQEHSCKNLL